MTSYDDDFECLLRGSPMKTKTTLNKRPLGAYVGAETRTSRITTLDYTSQIPYSPDEFMTVAEAAKFAKCSESRIRNLYRDHPIAKDVLGRIMISKTEFLNLVNDARSA